MTFGDFTDDDAYDPTAPPDPVQVARRAHDERRTLEDVPRWDELSDEYRAVAVEVMRRVLAMLRRQGGIGG